MDMSQDGPYDVEGIEQDGFYLAGISVTDVTLGKFDI